MNQKGFSPMIIIMILAVVIALGAIFIPMISRKQSPNNSSSQTVLTKQEQQTSTPIPSRTDSYPTKVFTSSDLGIRFQYSDTWDCNLDDPYKGDSTVTQVGNKIFIHDKNVSVTSSTKSDVRDAKGICSLIEVFNKKPAESLNNAVKRVILSGYPTYCVFEDGQIGIDQSKRAEIDAKYGGTSDIPEIEKILSTCPKPYIDPSYRTSSLPASGIEDKGSQTKFIFYIDNENWVNYPNWSTTIKISD